MMTGRFTRGLTRRIEALESTSLKTNPQNRDPRVEIAIAAMAWTRAEIEGILIAAESGKLDELPLSLCRRWATQLDSLAIQRFAQPFGKLLAVGQNPNKTTLPRSRGKDRNKTMPSDPRLMKPRTSSTGSNYTFQEIDI